MSEPKVYVPQDGLYGLVPKEGGAPVEEETCYLKSEADKLIAGLKAENERLEKFADELIKDCKWLYTNHTPAKNGFETIVLCKNGKKRVAKFRMFDLRWYDANNGDKLKVVKWLWQPRMPSDEKKYNDELRHHKYKRCIAMAKQCKESLRLMRTYEVTDDYWEPGHDAEYFCKKGDFYKKWRNRWLKLAEKFKEVQ